MTDTPKLTPEGLAEKWYPRASMVDTMISDIRSYGEQQARLENEACAELVGKSRNHLTFAYLSDDIRERMKS